MLEVKNIHGYIFKYLLIFKQDILLIFYITILDFCTIEIQVKLYVNIILNINITNTFLEFASTFEKILKLNFTFIYNMILGKYIAHSFHILSYDRLFISVT